MEAPSRPTTNLETGPPRRGFLADLVASGRFCRDTPLGSILHPRVESLREVTDGDSLHVLVGRDDKISVHVDRFSPVAGSRPDGCCRYSVRAVITHLAAHVAAQARQVARGARGRHRCRLECESVEVDDDAATTTGPCLSAALPTRIPFPSAVLPSGQSSLKDRID